MNIVMSFLYYFTFLSVVKQAISTIWLLDVERQSNYKAFESSFKGGDLADN